MKSALEALVWRRAHTLCEYCRIPQEFDLLPFQMDHIIARVHGGASSWDNLALACFACNNHKGTNLAGRDSETGKIVRLFHPRRHSWKTHFRREGPRIVGRTPIGRATVAVLAFNLLHRVALRAWLLDAGLISGS